MKHLCAELGLPLVVDAAQALRHVDCAVGADAMYASSRAWIAGPGGIGVLAVRPALMQRLQPWPPPPDWVSSLSVAQRLELGEAKIAARVGFSVALGEHLASDPPQVRDRLPRSSGRAAAVHPTASAAPLPYGPDTCMQGFVWREARSGDTVCVTPDVRSSTAQENAQSRQNVEPNGGAYGPTTCKQGLV